MFLNEFNMVTKLSMIGRSLDVNKVVNHWPDETILFRNDDNASPSSWPWLTIHQRNTWRHDDETDDVKTQQLSMKTSIDVFDWCRNCDQFMSTALKVPFPSMFLQKIKIIVSLNGFWPYFELNVEHNSRFSAELIIVSWIFLFSPILSYLSIRPWSHSSLNYILLCKLRWSKKSLRKNGWLWNCRNCSKNG